MAKKRKAAGASAQPSGPKEVDPSDARLGPITTYQDVADSEDEFFMNRDTLMLDDEPGSKRQKPDEDMELSDEEVFGYDEDEDEDEEEDDDDDDEDLAQGQSMASARKNGKQKVSGDAGSGEDEEEEGDSGWWGSSRKEYYNADNIETEADALEEEAEAKRLQKKKLSKMAEEDFIFDGDDWLAGEADGDEAEGTVTEVLKEVEIPTDMSADEQIKFLRARYPEFDPLVRKLQELQPLLASLQKEAQLNPGQTLEAVQYWVLGCYVASLASYFAILASPARDSGKSSKPLDPSELRDHEVMETLVQCREAWQRVKDLRSLSAVQEASSPASEDVEDMIDDSVLKPKKKAKKLSKEDKARAAKKARKLEKAREIEDSLADLDNLPLGRTKINKAKTLVPAEDQGDNSDFGEEAVLDARTAADKAARKKTLKFYTSQIAQKSNKRAGAGRDAGGDMDIPHRERLRDRHARLIAEAEKRGKKGSKGGADLGDDSDEDDTSAANNMRNDEDEYYDMVANKSKGKKDDKAARYAAFAAASKGDRVVENEQIGEDGKRKITYAIEKNKGLAPKRNKLARNPRVKKREQYKAKQKKLSSMKPVWKGGEPKGGYQGERAGINTSVIKSVKL